MALPQINWKTLLKRAPPPMVGVDISPSGVKLVELSGDPAVGLTLERFAIEPLERGAVVDGNIEKLEEVGAAIRKVVLKSGTKAKQVALALPSSSVITKKIRVPDGLRELELESQVESEAAQYVPFPIEEVNLDFQVIGKSSGSDGELDVLLAAARKERVEDRKAVADQAGLKAIVLDVESLAARLAVENFVRFLPREGQDQVIAVFDIGHLTTTLHVLLNGEIVFEREQSFGGQQLTQEIVRTYGLTSEDAERKKRRGGLPENYEKDLLEPFVDQAANELARTLQLMFTSTQYSRVDHILLAGGVSVCPGLAQALAQRTQVSTRVLNPFHKMGIAPNIDEQDFRLDAPSLLVAAGLAMRRFDE